MGFHLPHFKLRLLPRLRRADRLRSGATAVEMALLTPVFFYLLIGITEITLVEAAQQLLENAAYNTSRLAKTGFVLSGQNQAQTVSQQLDNELQSFGNLINTKNVTMTETAYNSFAAIGSGGTSGMGNPEQIVVYTVTYPWQLQTPMMGHIIGTQDANGNWIKNLTARIVVR